ncbi:MAG: hypothetical protein MnENMB40S_06250 [Rhizobiaceae bacterium MnEN-MB40S]|nr:MAG: hypothetical protein MnENMB40S_06250 [Rhizobiaceae bacterium MnEN-MB40S]
MSVRPAASSSSTETLFATLGVIVAAIGFGTVPFFARSLTDEGMAPHAVAFYRFAFTAIALLPTLILPRVLWRTIAWGIGAGIVMGVGWVGYVRAIEVAPVSTAGVLYMTYPVFTLVIARVMFGDIPTRRAIFAALLIIAAAVIATSPAAIEREHIPALIISLAAPFGFGFGINVLVHKLTPLPTLPRIACITLGSVIGLTPLVIVTPVSAILPASESGWLLVAAITAVTAFIPQLLYTVCAPVIGTARTAVAGSVELPTMFLVGWFTLAEPVGPMQWAACGLVIAAIVLTPSRITRNVAVNMATRS